MENRTNVTLIKYEKNGSETYLLLGPAGEEVLSFGIFAKSLERSPLNTRRRYCSALASFFDYFFEASMHSSVDGNPENLTRYHLRDIISSWKPYLIDGANAGDVLAQQVALTLPSPMLSSATCNNNHAALSQFLRLSERIRQNTLDFSALRLPLTEIDMEPLLQELTQLRTLNFLEHSAMLQSSMMTGVIAGGQRPQVQAMFASDISREFDSRSIFPLDNFSSFVDALPSFRDKALYCLYAASGCRAHEALQLLWQDIDIPNGEVRLVSPYTRINNSSYLYFTKKERDKLSWKGRETSETFLIEPFLSMFFENLEHYIREEYIPHGCHQFVFQILKRPWFGRPYFLSNSSTRQDVFKNAARRISLPSFIAGPHSLRHGYGTYLLNYLPMRDGKFGMPIGLVRVAMGHSSIRSTEKYAVQDKDLIYTQLHFANLSVFHRGSIKTQTQLKIEALKSKIVQLDQLEK